MNVQRGANGQVESINGRVGRCLAWLRLILPVTVTIFVVVVLPLNVWHFRQHVAVEKFIDKGPRVTPTDLENKAKDLRAEWVAEYSEPLPISSFRLAALEENRKLITVALESLRRGQADHGERLASIESRLQTVLLILQD